MSQQLNVIMKTVFGSHLYGLSTPESDMDFKGVFVPTAREIILGGRDVYNVCASTCFMHRVTIW